MLVRPENELDEYKKSGLVIPEVADVQSKPNAGIVVMTGTGIGPEHDIHAGDMLWFSKYAGNDFLIDEGEYRVLDFQEVLCRVVPTEEGAKLVEVQNG